MESPDLMAIPAKVQTQRETIYIFSNYIANNLVAYYDLPQWHELHKSGGNSIE